MRTDILPDAPLPDDDCDYRDQERARPEDILAFLLHCEASLTGGSTIKDHAQQIERNVRAEDKTNLLEDLWPRTAQRPSPEQRDRAWRSIIAIACLHRPGRHALASPLDRRYYQDLKRARGKLRAAYDLLSDLRRRSNGDGEGEAQRELRAMIERADRFIELEPNRKGRTSKGLPVECVVRLCDVYREATGNLPSYSKSNSRFCDFAILFAGTFEWERSEEAIRNDIGRAWKTEPKHFKNG
jgi:hypothetical protein